MALLTQRRHPLAVNFERGRLIVIRVRQIAALFSVLTVAWIAVDAATIAWPLWGEIALGRLVASLAFLWLAIHRLNRRSFAAVHRMLGGLIATPLLFFLFAVSALARGQGDAESLIAITAYYYSPFLIAVGLSIFPLTVLESAVFASPVVAAMVGATIAWPALLGTASAVATVWRLVLLAGISGIASLSQLRLLLQLTEQATRDGLTGLLMRRVGEELVSQQFSYAVRNDIPLAVMFVDLDNFKQVNDRYGHDAGDDVLRAAAEMLREALRREDLPVRWGGEEFLIALPGQAVEDAERVVRRIAGAGIGLRPDGVKLTASIGIAERKADAALSLDALIELADQRMYAAKRAGRNRYLARDEPKQWL